MHNDSQDPDQFSEGGLYRRPILRMDSDFCNKTERINSHTIILCDDCHSITGIHISRIITSLLVTNIVPGNICLHH